MTDERQAEIDELRKAVESLENRVEELEGRLDGTDTETTDSDLYDRYDRYVLDAADDVMSTHPRKLVRLYEEAGIQDKSKRKQRAKRLHRMESE